MAAAFNAVKGAPAVPAAPVRKLAPEPVPVPKEPEAEPTPVAEAPQRVRSTTPLEGPPTGVQGMEPRAFEDALHDMPDARDVARFLAEKAESPAHRAIAARIVPFIRDTSFKVAREGDKVPGMLTQPGTRGVHTYTVHKQFFNVVETERPSHIHVRSREIGPGVAGTDATIVLHELLHAATSRRLADARLNKNAGTELALAREDLVELFEKVVPLWRDSDIPGGPGRISEDELLAWGLTNKNFQDFLRGIEIEGKSAWTRFVEAVARMLGIAPGEHNALSELLRVTDRLLDAPLEGLPSRIHTKAMAEVAPAAAESRKLLQGDNPPGLTSAPLRYPRGMDEAAYRAEALRLRDAAEQAIDKAARAEAAQNQSLLRKGYLAWGMPRDDAEFVIARGAVEYGAIYDETGRMFAVAAGDDSFISFGESQDLAALLPTRTVVTHNHPNGSFLSGGVYVVGRLTSLRIRWTSLTTLPSAWRLSSSAFRALKSNWRITLANSLTPPSTLKTSPAATQKGPWLPSRMQESSQSSALSALEKRASSLRLDAGWWETPGGLPKPPMRPGEEVVINSTPGKPKT